MPGDELVPGSQYHPTRAVTIDAPPHAVWPWLVQVGCLQAGWYAHDILDNLWRPSATRVIPNSSSCASGRARTCQPFRWRSCAGSQPSSAARRERDWPCGSAALGSTRQLPRRLWRVQSAPLGISGGVRVPGCLVLLVGHAGVLTGGRRPLELATIAMARVLRELTAADDDHLLPCDSATHLNALRRGP